MKKAFLAFLLTFAGALYLFAQSQTYTFSPVFIGTGAPQAPTVPVPCPGVSIYFDVSTGQQYFCSNGAWAKAGQGVSTQVSVNPTQISFGTVQTSTQSPVQNLTINNTGSTSITINSVTLSDATNFTSSNLSVCNELLQAGAACVVPIQCGPKSAGSFTSTATINSTAGGTAPTATLTCTGTASASFTLTINGAGSGTVSSDDSLILCNISNGVPTGACTASYASGATPTLTATASPGSSFSAFSGGSCSTSPCTVTVSANTTVSATFTTTLPNQILSVTATGQGGGSVTSDVGGISCTVVAGVVSGTCSASVTQGTVVTLTESPDGSSTFVGWAGPCSGTSTTCAVTVSSNVTATTNFTPSTIPLSLVQTCSSSRTNSSYTCAWASAQTAGDIIMCGSGYGSGTVTVSSIADTKTNTYTQVPTISPKVQGGLTQVLYYAANIAAATAGANTTTITLSGSTTGEIRCAEYAGVATASPIDVSGVGTAGTGTALSITTPPTTTLNNDLITGWTTVGSFIGTADTAHGYKQEIVISGDDEEDIQGVATGTSINFQPTQTSSAAWIAFSVAWKAQATAPGGTTFSLTLSGSGSGNGTITSNFGSPTLNCTFAAGVTSGTCSTRVPQGGSGTLTAVASSGSVFGTFTGITGCSTAATCTVPTISQNTTVGASFNLSGTSNFYVNHSTGNDANAGTQASPWKTLQHANDTATIGGSGTIIHVADGTYNEVTSTGTCASFGFSSVNLCITKGGTSQSVRMVWQCDGGVGGGIAAIGHCQISGATKYGVMNVTNNVDFIGFDVGNTAAMGGGIQTVTTTNTAGAQAAQGNSFHVIGNYVHDLASTAVGPEGTGCPQNGGIGIGNHHGIWQSDAQILNNVVERMGVFPSTTCFNTHGIYMNGAPSAVVYNNIVVGVPAVGIMLTTTCGDLVSNNVLINAQTGIDFYGGDNNSGSCPSGAGLNSADNNIYDSVLNGIVFGTIGGGAAQCTASRPNWFGSMMGTITTHVFVPGTFSCDAGVFTFTTEAGANTFTTYNTSGTGATYALKSTSVAVNGGTTQCASGGVTPCVPSADIAGTKRPQGTAYDMGAFESF